MDRRFSYLFNQVGGVFTSATDSYDDGKGRVAGTMTPDQAKEFWGNIGEGTKLVVMWTPQGRIVITVIDTVGLSKDIYQANYGEAYATSSGMVLEKVTEKALDTPKAPGFAGRVAGYTGFLVEKVVNNAVSASAASKQPIPACTPPRKC
jgi:hypothetical protein